MVYRRNRRYRKRKNYAKKYINKYTSPGSIANKALHLARRVAKVINAEYKFFDVNEGNVQVSYNGYLPALCTPTVGTADTQRNGDSVKIQNLMFRANVVRGAVDSQFRLILLMDKQVKVSSLGDVLEVAGFLSSPISPKKYDNRFQTEILYDHRWALTADRPTIDINILKHIRQHTQFNNGTTTATSGKLLAIFVSDQDPATSANLPKITYYSRCSFTDN